MDVRRSINTKMWDDPWFSELNHDEKLLWIYLLTNSFTNMLGVYEITERKMVFDTGIPLERIRKAFESFERVKKAKYYSGYVILYNWIKNQSYNKNMIISALNVLNSLPNHIKLSINNKFSIELEQKELSLSKGKGTLSNRVISKNEDEKEIENEDEKEDVTNKVFIELSKSNKWIEEIAYFYKSDTGMVVDHLRKFYHHCRLTDSFKTNVTDLKKHFKNWVEIGNPIPKEKVLSGKETFEGF